jgi:carbamoyltransferase
VAAEGPDLVAASGDHLTVPVAALPGERNSDPTGISEPAPSRDSSTATAAWPLAAFAFPAETPGKPARTSSKTPNIKWNSRLRSSGQVADIWIPPFANDSGAAIGTAACELFRRGQHQALSWDVYRGPQLTDGDVPPGWRVLGCGERELAGVLHDVGEPVVVLSGRAELGPRALGNRSILAPATDAAMKDRLNAIKDRAHYRPVAPICLSARAAEVFTPGLSSGLRLGVEA